MDVDQLFTELEREGQLIVPVKRTKMLKGSAITGGIAVLCFGIYWAYHHTLGLIFGIIAAVLTPGLLLTALFPKFFGIHLSRDGIVRNGLFKHRCFQWNEIISFRLIKNGYQDAVGFDPIVSSKVQQIAEGIVNKAGPVVGVPGTEAQEVIVDFYALSPQELQAFLERCRIHFMESPDQEADQL